MKHTEQRVAKGVRADFETPDKLVLIKNVSELRATYQTRLLLSKAIHDNKKLVLVVPTKCVFSQDLNELIGKYRQNVQVERR